MHSVNPYNGTDIFSFFQILMARAWMFLTGQLSLNDLAPDEIQILVLVSISLSSALIGTFLVLRRMTMLANSLSHTILLGVVVAFILVQTRGGLSLLDAKTLFIAALVSGLITTVLTHLLHRGLKLQEDASIGLTLTSLFALGILLVTLYTRSAHIGVEAIMGNVDALHLDHVKRAFFLFAFNFGVVFLLYQPLVLSTFDPILGRNFGLPLVLISYLLMMQSAVTAIAAFSAVGVFLFLALLVAPVLTARFFTHRMKPLIALGMLFGLFSSLLAVACSRHLLSVYRMPLSTAGLATLFLGLFFLGGALYKSWQLRRGSLTAPSLKRTGSSASVVNQ